METLLADYLAVGKEKVHSFGRAGGGCINSGKSFEVDGQRYFIKFNKEKGSDVMFRGEFASLAAITATNAIQCPKPIAVLPLNGIVLNVILNCYKIIILCGSSLLTDYVEMSGGDRDEKAFARCLALMHLHNATLLAQKEKNAQFIGHSEDENDSVTQFGFSVPTCCGLLEQNNEWNEDWATFFIRNRLQFQVDLLIEKGDRQLASLWPQLELSAERILSNCSEIPGLIHGDLWSGNWRFNAHGPVIFDPASVFADTEYEQGIMDMFGGLTSTFWKEYHKYVPKRPGRHERVLLYELFHHLNHWNHFGGGYRTSSIGLITRIIGK